MTDSPFDDAFSLEKFYTQSSDRHHHSERTTIRVPGDWLHFASVVANSPKVPEYETISDIFRDGFAKAMKIALDHVNDPETTAQWSVMLGIAELEARAAMDANEERIADLWGKRFSLDHGYDTDHFHRDKAAMSNPDAIDVMNRLQQRYL